MKTSSLKLLAIIGSQRKNGNCYLLAKIVLGSIKANYEIVQLAEKEIRFCNLCEKCGYKECPLDDDFDLVLEKMKRVDGIIFSFPRYFFLPSKFLCFIERLVMSHHFKEYHGYRKTEVKPDSTVSLPFKEKPCCLFVVSATGWMGKKPMKSVAHEVERIGMKVVGEVLLKGEDIKEVLKDKKGIADCKKVARRLLNLMKSKQKNS